MSSHTNRLIAIYEENTTIGSISYILIIYNFNPFVTGNTLLCG